MVRDLRKLGGGVLAGLLLIFRMGKLIGVINCLGVQKHASSCPLIPMLPRVAGPIAVLTPPCGAAIQPM